jgi:SagB-type dehydrogenase family enzyme
MVFGGRDALEFHENTKHSYVSIRTSRHYLDWANRPYPFKEYEDVETVQLPRDFPKPVEGFSKALETEGGGRLNIGLLASILYFTGGITRVVNYGGEPFYFRAAPATGALYPTEMYVVAGDVDGLEPGLYHFSPNLFKLHLLRKGDYRGYLAYNSSSVVAESQAAVVYTSIAWRNAWKYRERSYRHWWWDSGVMVANMLSVARAFSIGAKVLTGFVDREVNRLVGVDGVREASIILVPLGRSDSPPPETPTVEPVNYRVRPLSRRETEYPAITAIHNASSLNSPEEVKEWREKASAKQHQASYGGLERVPLQPQKVETPLYEVILSRGSTRRFARKPISFSQLSTILHAAATTFEADFNGPRISIYLNIHAVDGVRPGAYFFDGEALHALKYGEFRKVSEYLCLEQELGGDSAATLFFMAPLEESLRSMGNRGYRAVQLEGGIRAGFAYLAAYASGVGATGLTFYDDDVREFFSPHAAGKENIITVAVGLPAYRPKPGRIILGV